MQTAPLPRHSYTFPTNPPTANTSDVIHFTTTATEASTVDNAASTTLPPITTPFPQSLAIVSTSAVIPATTTATERSIEDAAHSTVVS